jgi:hypothetical protein
MPKDIVVMGGESAEDMTELNKLTLKPYDLYSSFFF